MATQWNSGLTERSAGFTVTAAEWNKLVQNMNFQAEVAQTSRSTDVSITATTVGSANQILTLSAITYLNVPHIIEFSCVRVDAGVNSMNVILLDGTTVVGTLARLPANAVVSPFKWSRRFTPTAASHTYNVAAWNSAAATGTFQAGAGGTAGDGTTDLEAYLRIYRVPT